MKNDRNNKQDATLPSANLCAIMAYEHLKHGGPSDSALAWASLGNLILSLPGQEENRQSRLAIEVANAAHAVATKDTHQNRLNLQKALSAWIDVT